MLAVWVKKKETFSIDKYCLTKRNYVKFQIVQAGLISFW